MFTRILLGLLLCSPLVASAQNCIGLDPLLTQRILAILKDETPVYRATNPAEAANAWFHLNQRAEEFAKQLSSLTRNLPPQQAKTLCADAALDASLLIPIRWCEPDGKWVAATTGYLIYSQLLPRGRLAESAWWFSRIHDPQGCGGEYDGDSRQEGAENAKLYADFLKRFPHGKYAAQARQELADFQDEAANATQP